MHRVFKKNGVFTIPFIPFLTNIAVKTFKAVNNHTYCPTIFCTANNSWMLARERQQICENYWITQYLMNTLYIQTTLSITIFTTKVLPSWKKKRDREPPDNPHYLRNTPLQRKGNYQNHQGYNTKWSQVTKITKKKKEGRGGGRSVSTDRLQVNKTTTTQPFSTRAFSLLWILKSFKEKNNGINCKGDKTANHPDTNHALLIVLLVVLSIELFIYQSTYVCIQISGLWTRSDL